MAENMSNTIMDCTSLDELINVEYGPKGTENRDMFDAETQEFCVAQHQYKQLKYNEIIKYCDVCDVLFQYFDIVFTTSNGISSSKHTNIEDN